MCRIYQVCGRWLTDKINPLFRSTYDDCTGEPGKFLVGRDRGRVKIGTTDTTGKIGAAGCSFVCRRPRSPRSDAASAIGALPAFSRWHLEGGQKGYQRAARAGRVQVHAVEWLTAATRLRADTLFSSRTLWPACADVWGRVDYQRA